MLKLQAPSRDIRCTLKQFLYHIIALRRCFALVIKNAIPNVVYSEEILQIIHLQNRIFTARKFNVFHDAMRIGTSDLN